MYVHQTLTFRDAGFLALDVQLRSNIRDKITTTYDKSVCHNLVLATF